MQNRGTQYRTAVNAILAPSAIQQSNPCYEGGRIYYRSQNFLYCIGEK